MYYLGGPSLEGDKRVRIEQEERGSGSRGHSDTQGAKELGGLWELEKARKRFSPRTSREKRSPGATLISAP